MHAQKDGARIGGGAESCTSWRHMANVNTTWLVELSWREFRGSELQKSDSCTISQITSFAQISYTENAASNTLTAFQWFQKPLPYINHQNRSLDGDVLYSQASPSHDATLRVAHFSTLIWQAPLLFPDYEESGTATPILLTSCHSSFRAERHPIWTLSRWISDGIWERFLLPPWRWPIQLPASVQDMEPADLLQLLLHGSGQNIQEEMQGECREPAQGSDWTTTSSPSTAKTTGQHCPQQESSYIIPSFCHPKSGLPSAWSLWLLTRRRVHSEQERQEVQRVRSHLWHQEE